MPTNQSPHALIPVISLLLGACLWGVFWYPLRLLEARGLSGLWSTVTIFAAALSFSLVLVVLQRRRIHCHPLLLLVLAAASGWCNVAFIQAVLAGNVVRITLLFYLSPIWTVLLGHLILAERLDRPAKVTLAFALCGAMIMLWDSRLGLPWPQDAADWLAISSGFGFALSNVMVRRLSDEDIWIKTVFAWVGAVVLAAAWLLLDGASLPTAGGLVIGLAIVIGGIAMACMTLLVLYGLTHMPAHRAAVILLFELIAGAVSAELLTDEVVLLREWGGGVLIIVAGYFAARRQLRENIVNGQTSD
jgi:drug/metabolite transporter (DMT)-like permease